MSLLSIPESHPHAREPLGIYVHVPFCVRLCSYCDFYKVLERSEAHAAYVEGATREVEMLARGLARAGREPVVDTIYFGGGTPTSIGAVRLGALLGRIRGAFAVEPGAEVTVECNPEDATIEHLQALRGHGVNRLSIGVQSLDDRELALLERTHDAAMAGRTVALARAAGFENVSVDLIIGLPGQDVGSGLATLRGVRELAPEHVSAYLLELDKDTPLRRRIDARELPPPDDDVAAILYSSVEEELGVPRYEISSLARPENRSRHNMRYWTDAPYLGIGPSVASYYGTHRFTRIASLRGAPVDLEIGTGYTIETLSAEQALRDALMLGLRLQSGVSLDALHARHGPSPALDARVKELLSDGALERIEDRIRIPIELLPVANSVLSQLV